MMGRISKHVRKNANQNSVGQCAGSTKEGSHQCLFSRRFLGRDRLAEKGSISFSCSVALVVLKKSLLHTYF